MQTCIVNRIAFVSTIKKKKKESHMLLTGKSARFVDEYEMLAVYYLVP